MKQERDQDETKMQSLCYTRDNINRMVDMESHIKELCSRIAPDLDNCTTQDKKDAFIYLGLKITATPEAATMKGFIDSSLRMAGQSSR